MIMKVLLTSLLLVHECSASNSSGNSTDAPTPAPVRNGLGACNMTHTTALALMAQGNMSMAADLGVDCGGCVAFDPDSCPCMGPDICVLSGCVLTGDGCEAPRVGLSSCNGTHLDNLAALGEGNITVIPALGDCGQCMVADVTMCPCMGPDICAAAGCIVDGDHCAEPRAYAGSCGLEDAAALLKAAEGNETAVLDLSTNCSLCIVDDDDVCPCLSADLCAGEDECMVSGDRCTVKVMRPSEGSCTMIGHGTALSALAAGDATQIANLGTECGPCVLFDIEDICSCMETELCPLAGCFVDGEACVKSLPEDPPETPARPSPNSCTLAHAGALTALKAGDTSQLSALGEDCGGCIMAGPSDPCPCMDSTMCGLAGCTPEACAPPPAETTTTAAETTTTEVVPRTTTKAVYKPTTKVAVKAVTTFAEPLTEEAQTSVKNVFCNEVKATVEAEYADCDECTVECTITTVTRRRRLLAEVSYELSAEVTIPTSEATTDEAAETFGTTFQEAMETAITSDPAVVAANGGVAPTVEVKPTEVVAITTTTTTTEGGTTTDGIDFDDSSAAAVSCLLAVLVPVLL